MAMGPAHHPRSQPPPQPSESPARELIQAAGRRIELQRSGARLSLFVQGRALNEDQARIIALRHLDAGERLLDAVNDDPSADFTFVVWPRAVSHTGSILEELRAA